MENIEFDLYGGKINTVKMMVSSKIQYISMMLPFNLPVSVLAQYNERDF